MENNSRWNEHHDKAIQKMIQSTFGKSEKEIKKSSEKTTKIRREAPR